MNSSRFPTFRRFGKFLARCLRRLRRIFLSRRSAVVYVCLFTLGWLAISIDRWHGRRAWAAEKERLAAAGESLDLRDLLPARPPDAENFMAIPELTLPPKSPEPPTKEEWARMRRLRMWFDKVFVVQGKHRTGRDKMVPAEFPALAAKTPLKDWCDVLRRTGALPQHPLDPDPARELLLSARQWHDLFEKLYAASSRPQSMIVPSPAERISGEAKVEWAAGWAATTNSVSLHGLASVEAGDVAGAAADLLVLQRFAAAYTHEADLMSVLQAAQICRGAAAIVEAGMRRHTWSGAHLQQFIALGDTNLTLACWRRAIAAERIAVCHQWEKSRPAAGMASPPFADGMTVWVSLQAAYVRLAPDGFNNRQCAHISAAYSRMIQGLSLPAPSEGWAARIRKLENQRDHWVFANWFGDGILKNMLRAWETRRFLQVGCTLEQHYLVHRRYPASLSEISAALPPEALLDIDGQPLRYRPAADGSTFRLWSIGWNGVEDALGTKGCDDLVFSTE